MGNAKYPEIEDGLQFKLYHGMMFSIDGYNNSME
jgi:hypothetical protein